MTTSSPNLKGARIILRRPMPQDVDARFELGRHKEIVEAYGYDFDPNASFERSDAENDIRFIEKHEYAWVIDAGRFIGKIRLHEVVWEERRASIAIGMNDPAYLGRGYGTEAMKLVLAHAFREGFHRISLRVLATNTRAIACYQKCGFSAEGRERETANVNGVWVDDIIMGLLDREFASS